MNAAAAAAAAAAPTARPLQLDQWSNTKAPLSSSQRASVNRLAEWLHRNSSDYKPSQQSLQSQQQQQQQQASSSNIEESTPSADVVEVPLLPSTDPIALPDTSAPLASAQSFLAWYTQLSDSVSSSTHSSHIHALTHIAHTTATADSLLAHLDACQINVAELRAGSAFVHDSSRGIREQAQALLDSQTHLDTLAEDIASRLSFFTLLPYATNMLSSPDANIVYSSAFLELMDQLEMALLFLNQQPARTYRDAQLYRMRYAQCVTRAATLAKMAVVRDIKAHADHTAQRLKQLASSRSTQGTSDTTDGKGKAREIAQPPQSVITQETSEILFADAEQMVTKLRPLIFELAKRAASTADAPAAASAAEFESLLQECRAAWYQTRRPLLSRLLAQRIAEAEANVATQPGADILPLARTATQLLAHIVRSEYTLYQRFFGTDTSAIPPRHDVELAAYLGELTEAVASRLRPRLTKEHDLVVLADTASVVSDAIHAREDDAWARSMQALVGEVQSRLSARAHQVVVSDIAQFTPNADEGELDFAARILAYRSSARAGAGHQRAKSGAGLLDAALAASRASSSRSAHEKVALFTMPPSLASTYYTPVRTLLELLFHLQARLPARAFRRVASAAIDACLVSIGKGAAMLGKRGEGEDAWLFELRQCEILREAVVSADLVLSQNPGTDSESDASPRTMVDTSSLVTAINTLWTNTTSLLYPKDAKQEGTDMQRSSEAVSTRLHELISRTAALWARAIVLPLRVYIDQHTHAEAQDAKYASTKDAFDTCIASVLPEKAAKVRTWIEDPEVQRMLGARVAEIVAETYAKFTELGAESEGVDEVKQRVLREWNAALA